MAVKYLCLKFIIVLFLFFPAGLFAAEPVNTPLDATKGALPACMDGYSLYDKLVGIGEIPLWISSGKDEPVTAFFLNKENGSWSFVSTTYSDEQREKTCFAITGKGWQKVKIKIPNEVTLGGDEKKNGSCAPFETISNELLATGRIEVWSGFPDSNFLKEDIEKVITYLFLGDLGSWVRVTDSVYKNGTEMACIDTAGVEKKPVQVEQ